MMPITKLSRAPALPDARLGAVHIVLAFRDEYEQP
jgi:hypothetical protein